jgi:hypothetical protein
MILKDTGELDMSKREEYMVDLGKGSCVICNISYKELGVHPEPYENWTDGCPFCYEKSERLGDDE